MFSDKWAGSKSTHTRKKFVLLNFQFWWYVRESCHDRFSSHFSFCRSFLWVLRVSQQQQQQQQPKRREIIGFSLKCQQTLNWYDAILYVYVYIARFIYTRSSYVSIILQFSSVHSHLYIDEKKKHCTLYLFGCSCSYTWFHNTVSVWHFWIRCTMFSHLSFPCAT